MSQTDFGHYMECSLDLAVDLVNTENPVSGQDTLHSVAALAEFLDAHTVTHAARPSAADLSEVLTLRAALRQVFEAADEPAASALLNALLADSGAQPSLTNHDGPWHLHYAPSGKPLAPKLAAEAAMGLSVVIAQGGFERLHRCGADDCVDVFVDQSRNRSRRYCSPSDCGNRANVAAYRARKRADAV